MYFVDGLRPKKTIDELFDDFGNRRPQKPAKWKLFLIALAIAAVLIGVFNVVGASASVYIFQQQDTSTSTSYTSNPVGQSDIFFEKDNGTTTLSVMTAHLKYNSAGSVGLTHKICFYPQVYLSGSWYLDWENAIGCLSRKVLGADIGIDKDFVFSGSLLTFNNLDSAYYAWLNAGNATSSTANSVYQGWTGIGSINWYGSPNDLAYGGATIPTSVAFIPSYPSGLMYKNCPEAGNYTGVCDNFFILSAGYYSTEAPAAGYTKEELYAQCALLDGFFDATLCRLNVSLFTPSFETLSQFDGLFAMIQEKPPFGYFTQIKAAISNLSVGTTTLAFAGVDSLGIIFTPVRIILSTALWFLFALWIFHRIRNFDFF